MTPTTGLASSTKLILAIRVEQVGGFVGPSFKSARLPIVIAYTDGRVLAQRNVAGSVREMLQGQVKASELKAQISGFIKAAKQPSGGWGLPAVADVPSTEVSVTLNGTQHFANVYALGFTSKTMSAQAIVARTYLSKTISSLVKLAGTNTIYKPSQYEAWPLWNGAQQTGSSLVWPGSVPPPTARCTVVSAKPFLSLLRVAHERQWLLPSGAITSIIWRPVLPTEIACKR